MKTQAQMVEAIEALVDENNLSEVIAALALVCYEKSEHLLCNWQDELSAKRAGNKIMRLSDDSSVTTVS